MFLGHISQSIELIGLIERYKQGQTREDFLKSLDLQDKLVRGLEIIVEAVKNLPEELKATHPEILGGGSQAEDYLIHQYFGVDLKLTWDVIEMDIPDLKKAVDEMKQELQANRAK